MNDYLGLKQLDELINQPKGTAFRLFKSKLESLEENIDFKVLEAESDSEYIARLKREGRIYKQSHNVVLLSRDCFEQLKNQWLSINNG